MDNKKAYVREKFSEEKTSKLYRQCKIEDGACFSLLEG